MANIFREIPGRLDRKNFYQIDNYFFSYLLVSNSFFGDTTEIINNSIIKIWNGNLMMSYKRIKIWNGSFWITKILKIRNSSIWN